MNKLILSLLFTMAVASASAQKVYFVYLQTDAGQPFFIKMNEKVYSSTASGYLILSKLHDSTYNLSVGFPQNKWPEQKFSVVLNKKDHGYLLKNFGDKGWGLYDLESLAVQMSSTAILRPDGLAQSGKQSVSVFTDILARAADDPSLREKPVRPVIEEKKTEVAIQAVEKKEEPSMDLKDISGTKAVEVSEQPIVKKEPHKKGPKDNLKTKPGDKSEQVLVKKDEPKTESKEALVAKSADIANQPVVKKEEPTTGLNDGSETKPVELIQQPVAKKELHKKAPKDIPKSKAGDKSEQALVKTEDPKTKTESREVLQTKSYEIEIIQPIFKKEEPKTESKEALVTKPVEITDQPVVKKEEPKTAAREAQEIKLGEITEQPIGKKEDTPVSIKEVLATKPAEIVEQPLEKKEDPKVEPKEESLQAVDENKSMPGEVYKRSTIIKKSESSTTDGFGLVFIDNYQDGVKDTIRIIIPNPKPVVSPVKEAPKEERKFLDINADLPRNKEEKTTEVKHAVSELPIVKQAAKNNCVAEAVESDFFKLRKKMAAIEADDDMVNEARKYFKTKCFTATQVKYLSSLFLSDSGKYKFFDMAYSYVSDIENFSSLQAELIDDYYINRFKAMLK